MASLTFRCPRMGMDVAAPVCIDPASDPDVYEYVRCQACHGSHLLNKATGRLLGDKEE